jgi:hypothetical protein
MPKEERGFKYQKRTKDTLKERANMKGGNYDSYIKPKFKQWKPKEGKNVIRILPPTWDNARHYGLDIFVNYSIGADNQAYLSLGKHGKGADPIEEARREAQKEGEKKLADKLRPSQRILYWIIDRMDEDEGPLLWAAPFTFDKALSNLCIDEDTKDVIFIDDPAKGRDVRFYREGTALNTTYDASKMKVLKESNIHEDEGLENEWLDFIAENSLPEVLNFYEYDHIKAVFDGQAAPDDDDEDEDRPRGRGKLAKAEDEDEEKPTRARQRAKPRDDEPDEDEDEKPQRRTASRKPATEDDDEVVEEKPRSKRRVVEDEDEPAPKTRGPRRDPDDDELEESPRARSRAKPAPEDEDEDPPSTRRTKKPADEDEEGGGSLRERLAARRRSRNSEDE